MAEPQALKGSQLPSLGSLNLNTEFIVTDNNGLPTTKRVTLQVLLNILNNYFLGSAGGTIAGVLNANSIVADTIKVAFFESQEGYIHKQDFSTPINDNSNLNYILNAHAADGSTITPDHQPDISRQLAFNTDGDPGTDTITIHGTDNRGNALIITSTMQNDRSLQAVAHIDDIVLPTGNYNVSIGMTTSFGLDKIEADGVVLAGLVDGVRESILPTIVSDANIAKNLITFINSTPNGAKHFVAYYISTDVT